MNERKTVDEIIADEQLWSAGSMLLYHVTLEENVRSIMIEGIRPDLARGKAQASWYVSKAGILWAIAHTSLRHNVPVSELVVMPSLLPCLVTKRTGIKYAWCTKSRFTPEHWTPAEFYVYQQEDGNE